jgi:hypothetical protein
VCHDATDADDTSVYVPRLDFDLSLGKCMSDVGNEELSRQALFVSQNQRFP